MKITVIGTGYVGLVSGACLADMGNDVTCVDRDTAKIKRLAQGEIPIFEPGLEPLILAGVSKQRLHFTTDLVRAIQESMVIFLAVGTPPGKNQAADLSQVENVAHTIGQTMTDYRTIVIKSTVPVGTSQRVRTLIEQEQAQRQLTIAFDVVSNPEFLRQGNAVKDFLHPDRVVIGLEQPDAKAKRMLLQIYRAVAHADKPLLLTDIRSAELIKYASNCFLATKISFINEIANFCELIGADIEAVARGMGLDKRIGLGFLHAGIGYGGSCFPKDVRALIQTGREYNFNFQIIQAADTVNQAQRLRLITKLEKLVPNLVQATIGIWGLTFKANTDDLRDAPSLTIISQLLERYPNLKLQLYDPVANDLVRRQYPTNPQIIFADSSYEAALNADALLILTEWDEFRLPDFDRLKKSLKQPIIVDGRNLYDPIEMHELGFQYAGIGRQGNS